MSPVLQFLVVGVLAGCTMAQLGPVYVLQDSANIGIDNSADQVGTNFGANATAYFDDIVYYEWESYDGWYNNPAHPEWGGAGKFANSAATFACHCPRPHINAMYQKKNYYCFFSHFL